MNWLDQLYEDVMNNHYRKETVLEFPTEIAPGSLVMERKFRRYYHTDVHVRNMLDGWNQLVVSKQLNFTMAVAGTVGIIYHDAVYDPTRTDNEERSAELMEKEVGYRFGEADEALLIAKDVIIQTKHLDDFILGGYYNLIRDLDLKGLGGSRAEYRRNTWQIRQEYSMFTDDQFLDGRAKFLVGMLARKNIFRTPEFQHLEDRARTNILYELSLISKPDVWNDFFINFKPVTNADVVFL